MNLEYIIYNLVVVSGPLSLSFDKRVRYVNHWRRALTAAFITLVPFVIWDMLVTDRHWWFNPFHTFPVRILGLPIGEWLFFITVPFACLFIWSILNSYYTEKHFSFTVPKFLILIVALAGVAFFTVGKEYTGIVLAVFTFTLWLDIISGFFLQRRKLFLILMAIVAGLILIFNGFLTARPVVLYGIQYQLDWRIYTIPVEDFLYGISHIFLTVLAFEWLKKGDKNAA